MANSQISSMFTDLTQSEEASLSGGETVVCKGGGGKPGKPGKPGTGGQPGKPGKPGTGKCGKLSKAEKREIEQALSNLEDELSDLF